MSDALIIEIVKKAVIKNYDKPFQPYVRYITKMFIVVIANIKRYH